MAVLVTYTTQTGNTKKVAEAIFDGICGEKEIKPLGEVTDLDGYDLVFVGFPIVRFGAGEDVKQFLAQYTLGKRVALFVTHASPEEAPGVEQWLAPAKESARDADLVGLFHCQGALAPSVKAFMLEAPDPQLRSWAEMDNSEGQPDAARLALARAFGREMTVSL
jgi:flavodoxin